MTQYNAPFQRVSQHPRRWQQEKQMYAKQTLGPDMGANDTKIRRTEVERPTGEIAVQSQILDSGIDRLHNIIQQAASRLDPILRGDKPACDPNQIGSVACGSAMGSFLAGQNERLECAIESLQTIISRVEL